MNYVFDVDGTLTPSRGVMDQDFKAWFLKWCKGKSVWLATGSDYPKTLEQVGSYVCESAVTGVYNCAGNQLRKSGVLVYSKMFDITQDQLDYLEELLAKSQWLPKVGQHIEDRGSLVNFSTVGRAADSTMRKLYHEWDIVHNERYKLAKLIENRFPELSATVAGETGIDIYPKGWDKSQITDQLSDITFFGDKTLEGGNDYSIAQRSTVVYPVKDWQDTWNIMKELQC